MCRYSFITLMAVVTCSYSIITFMAVVTCSCVTGVSLPTLEDLLRTFSTAVTGDTYVLVGQDLVLNCTLSDNLLKKNCTSNDIFWIVSFPQDESKDEREISGDFVHTLDKGIAQLTLPVESIQSVAVYSCYVRCGQCRVGMDKTLVGSSKDVLVEYPPQDVTNFKCVVYNWDVNMTCTWQFPVQYVNLSNVKVTFVYMRAPGEFAYPCPQLDKTRKCEWNASPFLMVGNYSFEINVTNIRTNTSTSAIFTQDTFEIVQPAPVENLVVEPAEAEQPGCFNISWTHPKSFPKKFRVRHCIKANGPYVILSDNMTATAYTACGYAPYTWHKFCVESYPLSSYSGFWSESVCASDWTIMTAPDLGPSTTNGSFTATSCVDDIRNVTMFWQDVPVDVRNGIIDRFIVKVGEQTLEKVANVTFSSTVELDCNSTTEVQLLAHNEGGYSLNPSLLIIPGNTAVPERLKESFAVAIVKSADTGSGQDKLQAVWAIDEDMDDLNYTVFWCYSWKSKSCGGPIHWSRVSASQGHLDIPQLPSFTKEFQFGISVPIAGSSLASEIHWTGCLYKQKVGEVPVPQNMKTLPGEKKVVVTWDRIHCSYQSMVKVEGYRLKYCEEGHCSGTDEVPAIDISETESSFTVDNLKSNVNYKITLQAKSGGKISEEIQTWITVKPAGNEEDKESVVWIALGTSIGVFMLVVVLLLAWYIYRKCSQAKRKYDVFLTSMPFQVEAASNDSPPALPPPRENTQVSSVEMENLLDTINQGAHPPYIGQQGTPSSASGSTNSSLESFTNDETTNSRAPIIRPKRPKRKAKMNVSEERNAFPMVPQKSWNEAQGDLGFSGGSKSGEEVKNGFEVTSAEGSSEMSHPEEVRTSDEASASPYMRMSVRPSSSQEHEVSQAMTQENNHQVGVIGPMDSIILQVCHDNVTRPETDVSDKQEIDYSLLAPTEVEKPTNSGYVARDDIPAKQDSLQNQGEALIEEIPLCPVLPVSEITWPTTGSAVVSDSSDQQDSTRTPVSTETDCSDYISNSAEPVTDTDSATGPVSPQQLTDNRPTPADNSDICEAMPANPSSPSVLGLDTQEMSDYVPH